MSFAERSTVLFNPALLMSLLGYSVAYATTALRWVSSTNRCMCIECVRTGRARNRRTTVFVRRVTRKYTHLVLFRYSLSRLNLPSSSCHVWNTHHHHLVIAAQRTMCRQLGCINQSSPCTQRIPKIVLRTKRHLCRSKILASRIVQIECQSNLNIIHR